MAYLHVDFPSLTSEHIASSQLFANRYDMIKKIHPVSKPVIAEVGVATGDFSEFIIEQLKPSKFVAIDSFEMEKYPFHWGIPQEILLNGLAHEDYYKQRFEHYGELIQIEKGLSADCLSKMPDDYFDIIYIDAGHAYENVRRDGEISQSKLKHNGIIIFNDYIMYDPFINEEYGVVQAVNEILNQGGWKVDGFALEKNMFCDIAISRSHIG